MVQQEHQLETADLGETLGISDPARLDRLIRVAHGYSGAVGIIDALRIQGWSDDGLTIPQMRLLWALRDEDGLPVGALAEQLGVNPSTITGHVDRLVRQDLVRREEDADDRRIVRNYLTETGRSRSVRCGASRVSISSTSSSGSMTGNSTGSAPRSRT